MFLSLRTYAEDSPQQRTGFIIVPSLKIGSEPGISNPVLIGSLKYGDAVWIQDSRDVDHTQWFRIQDKRVRNVRGWVPAEYVGIMGDPNSVSQAVRRIEKEISKRLDKTPHIKELIQNSSTPSNLSSLTWEELRLAVTASLMQKTLGHVFHYLCAAYDSASSENAKQKVIALATLLHPTALFRSETFRTQACQSPTQGNDALGTSQEKLISYVYVWKSFW